MCFASTNFVSLRHYKTDCGAKINKFINITKSLVNKFTRKFHSILQMAENKRIKILVHWLISQGIIASQQDLGEKFGIANKSYLSQLVNGRATSPDFINKLSKLDSRINAEWLETGKGNMIIEENGSGQQFNGPITGDNPQFAGHDFTNNPPCNFGVEVERVIAAMNAQADLTKEAHAITRRAQDQVDRAQAQVDVAQQQINRLLTMLELKLNIQSV